MIKNAAWNEAGTIIHVEFEDGIMMFVPDDMSNRHRVELEEWSKAKKTNVIKPYRPPAEPKASKHK